MSNKKNINQGQNEKYAQFLGDFTLFSEKHLVCLSELMLFILIILACRQVSEKYFAKQI